MAARPPIVDVATVRQLSHAGDVNRLLVDAVALERSIDADLEHLLASSAVVDDALVGLRADTADALGGARADAAALRASTADTAALADAVSRKVRELDAAQSRVRATLARIEVVVDRARAVEGAQAALARDDLDAAAGCVARFLEIQDEEAGAGAAARPAGAAADQAAAQDRAMGEARAALEAAVRARAAAAVHAQDHAAVSRLARLYGPMRLAQEGVDLMITYLRALVARRAQEDYDALVDGLDGGGGGGGGAAGKGDYLAALTNLFRDVAAAVDEHLDMFRDAFGPELALVAVHGVHAECDIRATRLLQRYADHRGLGRLAGQISMRRRDDTAAESAPVEPRRVEAFLGELLALCTRGEEYTQFVLARMAEAAAPSPLPPARETALRGGGLSSALRELLAHYISLEEYYVEESVAKAVRIDDAAPGALTSSMVDDAFFVLLSAGRRALATARAPSAVAILNQLNAALSTLFRAAVAAKLQGAAARIAGGAPPEPGAPPSPAAAAAAVALNNAEVSAAYVGKLRQQLEQLAAQLFPAPNDRDRIKLVLADLGKTAAEFRALAARGVEQLCAALMPRLRPALDEVAAAPYDLGAAQFVPGEGWPHALLAAMALHLGWTRPLLTPASFDALVHAAVDVAVARLEAAVAQKRFTQVGGLQLERDVRTLVGESEGAGRELAGRG
jgi:hypothetical protein